MEQCAIKKEDVFLISDVLKIHKYLIVKNNIK